LSTLGPRRVRSDARRNAQGILDATAAAIAIDAAAGLEEIARGADVSRATLYHHFASRDALLDALTERSIGEVRTALAAAHPEEASAAEALDRVLRAAWRVIGRYRGLVIVNQRLPRETLRARLDPALAPLRALVERGQRSGEFDPDLPADWLIGTLTDLIHAASRQVSADAMTADAAERALLRTATAAFTGHRPARRGRAP
jgi:TetR/AcrR family transcriptional regulator, mexCD-oprJ operon repressor